MRLAIVLCGLISIGLVGSAAADHIKGTSCGNSISCAGHQYWPRMTFDDVQKADVKGSTLRGRPDKVNELLGWHGSDTLFGGEKSDVLWADHIGTGQPTTQRDVVYGRGGSDFLYSSHGLNTLLAGTGNDAIKIRYGRGTLDCGPGQDIVYVPRKRRARWKLKSCEKFDYRTEAQRGDGIKPLP